MEINQGFDTDPNRQNLNQALNPSLTQTDNNKASEEKKHAVESMAHQPAYSVKLSKDGNSENVNFYAGPQNINKMNTLLDGNLFGTAQDNVSFDTAKKLIY